MGMSLFLAEARRMRVLDYSTSQCIPFWHLFKVADIRMETMDLVNYDFNLEMSWRF